MYTYSFIYKIPDVLVVLTSYGFSYRPPAAPCTQTGAALFKSKMLVLFITVPVIIFQSSVEAEHAMFNNICGCIMFLDPPFVCQLVNLFKLISQVVKCLSDVSGIILVNSR